eukprot:GFUD01007217.1.p1 GENE.GFUD01007217.1~~GFUD01007217.1.p1  ORF type:complete len:301 (+),score=87.52 GFUD01007217.1:116-1018(+)
MEKSGKPEKQKRFFPIPHSDLAEYCSRSPLPRELQEAKILDYDTNQFPFQEAIADILNVCPADLATIHETGEGKLALAEELAGSNHRKRGKQPHYLRLWTSSSQTPARQRFNKILHQFVDQFVSVHMGGTGSVHMGGTGRQAAVAYQREPTFRTVLPSGQEYGYRHCDADYHHPPAEVNWWLPVTQVFGSNTLHTESEPGRGDFSPVQLKYGQVLRFYGNLCQHYAVPNTSGKSRVSFDLRVLSVAHHDTEWTDRLGRQCLFKVGAYYTRAGAGSEDTKKLERGTGEDPEEILDCADLYS